MDLSLAISVIVAASAQHIGSFVGGKQRMSGAASTRAILCIYTAPISTPSQPTCYNRCHPERTLLYQTVAAHYKSWLDLARACQFDGQGDHHSPKPYVRKAFEKYLEYGIFAHGFARPRCEECGHDFLVTFSCKGRGVCPSCNTRRMAETASHLTDHVSHPATGVHADALTRVQARLRKRILRVFVGRGQLEDFEAREMQVYKHSGFSVHTRVCIAAHDRAGLERLLWCCARPPFALDRLRKAGSELVYRCAKQHSEPGHNKRSTQVDEITLTPLELIDRQARQVDRIFARSHQQCDG